MKQNKALVLALSLLCSVSLFGLAKTNSFSLRISSYNMENFWDADPHNTESEWVRYKWGLSPEDRAALPYSPQYSTYSEKSSNWYDPAILDAKINNVIEVLKLMKSPDIVALQELESARNTATVFDALDLKGESFKSRLMKLGYKYFVVGPQEINNPVSVTTAFISKVKLTPLDSLAIRGFPFSTSARDLQLVSLDLGSEKVLLVNNHWKSKRGGNDETRVEIAKALKKRINQEKAKEETHVIILGDLNAAYYENPLEALGTTDLKSSAKERNLLYNLWYEKPEEDRWESSFNGVRGTLSHIIISPSLLFKNGFHYSPDSFEVFGHGDSEKDLLIDVNGQPFRWQVRFFYDYFLHLARGYSDHLPLVAKFSYNSKKMTKRKLSLIQNKIGSYSKKPLSKPTKTHFNEIEPCDEDKAINLLKIRHQTLEDLDRKCVKIELERREPPLTLYTRGRYKSNYIIVPTNSRNRKSIALGLTMSNEYSWHPNLYDSRVTYDEANIKEGFYNDKNWHPKSNKCFLRKVLQRKGGALRKVIGRLGYTDGYFSIHIISREASQIQLENLPMKKKQACPWNFKALQ